MIVESERAERVRKDAVNGIKPLVSLILFTYNQEKYIEEAIGAALGQTYQPLEIVISDDCSADNTWGIVTKMVAQYKGPHKVVVNRNIKNMGVTRHFMFAVSLCKGDFIVVCAGDDIALSNKVQVMVDKWSQDDYRPLVCFTNMYWMEENGERGKIVYERAAIPQTRDEFLRNPATGMPGASAGFSRDVIDIFGPLDPIHASSEDVPTSIRGALLDHLVYIDSPTMYWRKAGLWSGMVGHPEYEKKMYKDGLIKSEAVARQALVDALHIKDYNAIRSMIVYWVECDFKKSAMEHSVMRLPMFFAMAFRRGGKFWHLLRSTYRILKYKWRYGLRERLFGARVKHAYEGDREIIYEERLATMRTNS